MVSTRPAPGLCTRSINRRPDAFLSHNVHPLTGVSARMRMAAPALGAFGAAVSSPPPATEVDQTLNPRVADLKVSKTMALTDLARSMREGGQDVIGLAAGEPDFDTPEPVVEAGIEALRDGFTRYTPNTGTASLRKAIVDKLRVENGLQYSTEEIVISNGAKQSIWQAVLATVSPGDEVIVPAPYWVSYPSMVSLAGGQAVIVDTLAEEGYLLTAEQLSAALTPQSRILILCSPSNPTGAVYPLKRLQEMAAVVAEHPRLLVISDEIYEHIIYPPAEHSSFAALPDMWSRTLTVNGFSKAFAMTGWRLGYLAAPLHFAKAAAAIQSQSTSGAGSISQQAALTALGLGTGGGQPVRTMRAAFQERRDFIVQRLQGIEGMRVTVPDGAFYIFPDVSNFFGPGVRAEDFGDIPDADTLCRYLIEKALVALVPGDAFGAPGCLRISYAASLATIKEAMDRVERALHPSKLHC